MAHYRCEKCSKIVAADETPGSCEECGAGAREAYPDGPVADDETGRVSVEGLFDISGFPRPDAPHEEEEAKGVEELEVSTDQEEKGGLAAVSTMELDEGDLVEAEEEGEAPAKPPPPAPPAPPAAPGPLEGVSTMELDESDLEEQGDVTPPPVPAPPFQPRAGRVAYPIPADRDAHEEEPERHVEMNEMAAAGLPPAPPTPDRALSTQTRGLGPQAGGRRKAIAALAVVGVGGVVTVALLLGDGPATQGRLDGGTPDLRTPDLQPSDIAPPDLRPDRPAPDAPAPDTARPRPRPRVAGTSAAGTSAAATSVRRPVRRPRRPPDAGAIGDPLEEARRHYKEGLQALIRGQLNGAVGKFNMALKRNPHLSMAYRGLGLAYQKSGKAALARAAFQRYLRMRPGAPDAAAIRKRLESL